jgi:hypothetical protein
MKPENNIVRPQAQSNVMPLQAWKTTSLALVLAVCGCSSTVFEAPAESGSGGAGASSGAGQGASAGAGQSSTASSGGTGSGCVGCYHWFTQATGTMCSDAKVLHDAFDGCFCAACSSECESYCKDGQQPSEECGNCFSFVGDGGAPCENELKACLADK